MPLLASPSSLQQGILQGSLPIPTVFALFRTKFSSDSKDSERNSLRNGAGNFCRPSRDFFGLAGNCGFKSKTIAAGINHNFGDPCDDGGGPENAGYEG
jgi:hypothetical protein